MNQDNVKGKLQELGGRLEEAAGALFHDETEKTAGKQDQLKGQARNAWGNVKDAGDNLVDQARAAKADAELKSERAEAFERDHKVEVTHEEPHR
jgi:uncharacterized protein YjbJ (UPF0337 family)